MTKSSDIPIKTASDCLHSSKRSLKAMPCPFCGQPPLINRMEDELGYMYNVECVWSECEVFVSSHPYRTERAALRRWNRRDGM